MISAERTNPAAITSLLAGVGSGPADLGELHRLVAAQNMLDELLQSCLQQLQGEVPKEGPLASVTPSIAGWEGDADTDLVSEFWKTYSSLVVWDFVPTDFLHALYIDWLLAHARHARATVLTPGAFARRINLVASATGQWTYARVRASRATMGDVEPLLERIDWQLPRDGRARYGLRRTV